MKSLLDTLSNIAYLFEKACCIKSFVVDAQEPDGLQNREQDFFCAVCAKEQLERKGQLQCENIHRHGVLQAEKWGGKYEYLCPAGAAFICAVIQENEGARYGVAAGPFLMVDLNEFIYEDLERFFIGETIKRLKTKAKELPYFHSGRVSYLANILSMITAYAAERESFQLQIMQQVAKSQNEAYNSLYGLKNTRVSDENYPIMQEKKLQLYISRGDKAASQKVLNEILGSIFFCSGGSFEYIKARIIELVVILSRAAIEGGADISEVFGLNRDYISDVQHFSSLDDLNRWLAGVLIRFTSSVFDFSTAKHADQIKRVIKYVKRNHMKKISLNDISNDTNLSVSYLSKIFKDETGQSLSAYVNQIRIDSAKMFLLDASIPLTDVAYLSGFEDQSYFSKVFKKVTNVTPGKYREKKGNIK